MENKYLLLNLMKMLALTIAFAFNVQAGDLNSVDHEALDKTKSFLKDKSQRDQYIRNNPESQKPVQQMNSMGMNQNQQNKVFNISADVFDQLVKNSGGDAEAVKKKLLEAQGNPEAFYKSLDPKSREMIKNLSSELESKSLSSSSDQ